MTLDRHDDALWQEALSLMLQLRENPSDFAANERVRLWQRQSAAHAAAWAEAEQVWHLTGQAHSGGVGPEMAMHRKYPVLTRRRLVAGLGAAAAIGTAGIVGPRFLNRIKADYSTGPGEIRSIDLPDRSVVTLGPESTLALSFSQTARGIELIDGLAYFDVSRGSTQALAATCGPIVAKADDASFDLSQDAGLVTLSADRGKMIANIPRGSQTADFALTAGDWISFDTADQTVTTGRLEREYRAAWRHGLIIAEREPVATVVAKVARWYAGKVVIVPGFGRRRVSGIFDLRDPLAALEAIVAPFDGSVRRVTSWLVVVAAV